VNIHGKNYEVNINQTHNAQSAIDIGNGCNANHPREMPIDICNNDPLNKFCWLSISTIRKWKAGLEDTYPTGILFFDRIGNKNFLKTP
jgi:hypothetical protein